MELHEAIMNTLSNHWGEDRAIDRLALEYQIGELLYHVRDFPSDRQIRAEIRKLRTGETPHPYGPLICSHSSTGGYYLSKEPEDLRKSMDQKVKHGVTMIRGAREQYDRAMAALANAEQQRMF
jgi:hypothetical protein